MHIELCGCMGVVSSSLQPACNSCVKIVCRPDLNIMLKTRIRNIFVLHMVLKMLALFAFTRAWEGCFFCQAVTAAYEESCEWCKVGFAAFFCGLFVCGR